MRLSLNHSFEQDEQNRLWHVDKSVNQSCEWWELLIEKQDEEQNSVTSGFWLTRQPPSLSSLGFGWNVFVFVCFVFVYSYLWICICVFIFATLYIWICICVFALLYLYLCICKILCLAREPPLPSQTWVIAMLYLQLILLQFKHDIQGWAYVGLLNSSVLWMFLSSNSKYVQCSYCISVKFGLFLF